MMHIRFSKILRTAILTAFLFFMSSGQAYAFDLVDYIANVGFEEHTLSTGERIRFESAGGSSTLGYGVRQYKNDNWEQFFLSGDWIYRREDTSWAPQGATHSSGDATCQNGNKAIYTLDTASGGVVYNPGDNPLTDGAGWAPSTGSFVGQVWSQQTHTIVPIDAGVPPGTYSGYPITDRTSLRYCPIEAPIGYPAYDQAPSLKITGFFESGEYRFCTGHVNPQPVVTISGNAGAGSGDGFAYMRGCGLVGFSDETLEVGLVDGCGVNEEDIDPSMSTCGITEGSEDGVPIEITGSVKSSRRVLNPITGAEILNVPLKNVAVAAYQGSWDYGTGKRNGGQVVNLETQVFTDENGKFQLTTYRTEDSFDNSNYLAFFCEGNLVHSLKLALDQDILVDNVALDCHYRLSEVDAPGSFHYIDRATPLNDRREFSQTAPESNITPSVVAAIEFENVDADDTYIGSSPYWNDPDCDPNQIGEGGCMPPDALTTARVATEILGTAYKAINPTGYLDATWTIMGTPHRGLRPPRTDEDELQLPLCIDYYECNSPIAENTTSERNSQTCGGPAINGAQPLTSWEARYDVADQDMPICIASSGEVKYLRDFPVPWEMSAEERSEDMSVNPYATDELTFMHFPYWKLFLPGDQLKTEETTHTNQITNDSWEFLGCREDPFYEETVGTKPFCEQAKSVYPAGPSGLYGIHLSDSLYSDQTIDQSEHGGAPVCMFNSPFTPCGDSAEDGVDPDVQLQRVGRGYFVQGLQVATQTCNTVDYEGNNNCDYPFNNEGPVRGDSPNPEIYTTGAKYDISGGTNTFYGDGIVGGVIGGAIDLLNALYSTFSSSQPEPGSAECLGLTWGPRQDGVCPLVYNTNICEQICAYTGFDCPGPASCGCPDPVRNCTDGYILDETGLFPSDAVLICEYRVRDQAEPYGTGEGVGPGCEGDIQGQAQFYNFIQDQPGTHILPGALEMALSFAEPAIVNPQEAYGCLETYDFYISKEKDPDQGQGRGNEYGASTVCSVTPYFDVLRASVSDPVFPIDEEE